MLLLATQAGPQMLAYSHPHLGRLVQPFHYPRIADTAARGVPWAADTGGFEGETVRRFARMLPALQGLPGCLFVVSPDVVGDAEATDLLFAEWSPRIRSLGLPVAYVVQERGEDVDPHRIPWAEVEAIFIGCAEDRVKLGPSVRTVAQMAKERGKWLHMGRRSTAPAGTPMRRRSAATPSTGPVGSAGASGICGAASIFFPPCRGRRCESVHPATE
jgi:hypothetical protein